MKKTLLLALLAGFVASILAVSGEAAAQKKKRKKFDPEARFKQLDKDKNGFVSKDEFIGGAKGKKGKERAERAWTRMEKFAKKDKEKGLTLEEFKAASVRKRKKKKDDA
jgi:Ca2+-binding EF-hand superfamily protein